MTYNRNPLYQAVHYALGAGAVAGMAFATGALAQDQEQEPAELDRQLVTGSRLSQVDIEGASPVTVLDRQDIERIGLNDLGDIIRQLPTITGSPLSTRTNNGGNGATAADIRGLGAIRTLVLINGKRDITDGDFSLIPIAAVERIEVLAEGAAAIYGADAVSGVINIITRKDFQGAQLSAQYGASFELVPNPAVQEVGDPGLRGSDGDTKRVSFVFGDTTEKSSFLIGAEYNEQDPVFQGNVNCEFFQFPISLFDADIFAANGPIGCEDRIDSGMAEDTTGLFRSGSSRNLGGFFVVPGQGALTNVNGQIVPFTNQFYNFAPVNFVQTPFERTNLFVQGDYDLFEHVEAFIEARYANRRSSQLLAPLPFDGRFDPGFAGTGTGVSADNVFNPFGVDIRDVRRRVAETGGRDFSQSVNSINITTGLRGDLGDIAPTWSWEVFWNWGREDRTDIDEGQFVGSRLAQALGPSFFDANGVATCGTPDAPIAGCVPLNLFGGNGTITQEMLDFVSFPLVDNIVTKLQNAQATVTGDLFDLPGGAVAMALGYEFRQEELAFNPDSGKASESVTGNTGAGTSGIFDVNSVFAELNLPLLSRVPGAELLEVGVGFRYDDFSTVGSTGNFMFKASWQPFKGFLVRGSYSEVFREPTIGELFSAQGDSFPSFQDICSNGVLGSPGSPNLFETLTPEQQARCIMTGVPAGGVFQTDVQVRSRVGGNPNVRPENGETWTVGFAFAPEFIPGFSFTVDYWEVDLDDAITSIAAGNVITECVLNGDLNQCANITRFADGNINAVVAAQTNIGSETAAGIDFAFNYNRSTAIGLFDTRLLVTYLDERESTVTGDPLDIAGFFSPGVNGFARGVFPEWKGLFTIDWSYEDLGAAINIEYIDSLTDLDFDAVPSREAPFLQSIESEWYVDLVGRYTLPWGTTFSFGITNLFNNDPPFIVNEFNASTDTDTYRLLGRSWFANLTHNF